MISFVTDAGDPIIWEHLGMLDRPAYRKAWEWKREWYKANGFAEGKDLFVTSEGAGLDATAINAISDAVQALLE